MTLRGVYNFVDPPPSTPSLRSKEHQPMGSQPREPQPMELQPGKLHPRDRICLLESLGIVFFGDFSGNLGFLGKILGIFPNLYTIKNGIYLNLVKLSLNLVKFRQKQGFSDWVIPPIPPLKVDELGHV